MRLLNFLSSFLLLAGAATAYPGPGVVTGSIDVHDPSALCKDSSGTYFLFATAPGISIRTSKDRTAWTYRGVAFSNPTWTDAYTGTSNGNLWAPDCVYNSGTFYLYYSASTFGSSKSAIFFAKSTTGLPGSWTNQGLVTSTTASSNYNAIDPNLIISGSNWYLAFGSWWTGIKLMTLSSSTGKPSSSTLTSLASRSNGIEAASIVHVGSYWYLFTSWDKCCSGTSSTYNIRVGRSSSISGPYVDQAGVQLMNGGGTLVLATHDSVYGPGGQTVYQDSDAWVLVYHYYTSSGSKLGINLLNFSSGWPVAY